MNCPRFSHGLFLVALLFTFSNYPLVNASVQPFTPIVRDGEDGTPFSLEALQPTTPSDAIPSKYSLVEELLAWSDLSVLFFAVANYPELVEIVASLEKVLVFAPTNDAFRTVVRLFLPEVPEDAGRDVILSSLFQIYSTLVNSGIPEDDIESLALDVLKYHIVQGDLSEQDIAEGSPLVPLLSNTTVDTSEYPLSIEDLDPLTDSARLGRQILTANGRISIIDNALLPFDLSDTLGTLNITLPSVRQQNRHNEADLFHPLRSLVDFVTLRSDLLILTELVSGSDLLLQVLSNSQLLHVFAPTDRAFIELLIILLPEEVVAEELPYGGDVSLIIRDILFDPSSIKPVVAEIARLWEKLDGVPSLEEIVAYHVLNTGSSFSDLVGLGPQQTLFSSESSPVNEITIIEGAVQDADPSADTGLIASFATQKGFVSVIEGVLLPFTVENGQAAVLEALASPSSEPEPDETEGPPFSNSSLQPNTPAEAISSTYNLVEELSAWSDASVLVALLTEYPELVEAAASADPLLVFAPTNDAFLNTARLFLPDTAQDATSEQIVAALVQIWETLTAEAPDITTVEDVLKYHIVAGDLPEQEIADSRKLKTLLGRSFGTARYPRSIGDANPGPSGARLGRQINPTNGRVSFIDSVLIPFNLKETLASVNITLPLERQAIRQDNSSDSLFKPFRSLVDFVTSRNDLIILTELVSGSEVLLDVLSGPSPLHVFAPNDLAFIDLVQALVPEEVAADLLPGSVEDTLRDPEALKTLAQEVAELWESLEGVPSLVDIVSYHALNTSESFEELVGAGPQQTLFSSETFENEITVVEGAVQDADENDDSELIASFATRNGYVSVVGGVLIPFTVEDGRAAVSAALNKQPMPSQSSSPEISVPPEEIDLFPTEGSTSPEADISQEPEISFSSEPPASSATPASNNEDDDDAVCFPSSARIQLEDGTEVRMDKLQAGHNIHIGDGVTSPVFLFTHRQPGTIQIFKRITTKSGHQVSLTPSHYLYANGQLTAARAVKVGDELQTADGVSTVEKTETLKMSGLYAPHTIHGDMMVDGVLVSGYSRAVHPRLAHALLAPVRLFVKMTGVREPLGGVFYDGADRLARIMPNGNLQH